MGPKNATLQFLAKNCVTYGNYHKKKIVEINKTCKETLVKALQKLI